VSAAQRRPLLAPVPHLGATELTAGAAVSASGGREVSIVIHNRLLPGQIPRVSSDENNIPPQRSSSGSTRNAAATRPQPTTLTGQDRSEHKAANGSSMA
jgi:hypothetical protein